MSNTVSEAPRNLAAQFATDSTDRLNARCNMRIGLWAGAKLGLPEERRAVYALEVMLSGMIDLGHDDVIDKIMHDFNKHEIPMTRGQILAQLSKEHYCVMTLSHLTKHADRCPLYRGGRAQHIATNRNNATDRQIQCHQSPSPSSAMIRPRIQS